MKRTIVTGAAGFVGANLAARLLAEGHEVHLFVRPTSSRWRLERIEDGAEVHELELEDADAVVRAVQLVQPDWVLHLAARGGYSWQSDPHEILGANVIGTGNLLEACARAGIEAFVNTGSSSEYGFKRHAPAEDEPLEPNSVYAAAKAAATLLCGVYAREAGLRVVTLRLYSVYGPYEEPGRLVAALALAALEGRLPPLVSPGVARDFVFVEDVLDAYLLAAREPPQQAGEIYNVGTGRQVTVREAVEVARALLGVDAEPEWGSMPERTWDTETWVADNRKIRRELGWEPRRSFEQGFAATVEWFRSNPALRAFYAEAAARRT